MQISTFHSLFADLLRQHIGSIPGVKHDRPAPLASRCTAGARSTNQAPRRGPSAACPPPVLPQAAAQLRASHSAALTGDRIHCAAAFSAPRRGG